MSKYDPLWRYVAEQNRDKLLLRFSDIQEIAGLPVDHSFLNFKKELLVFGFHVGKISMKNETVEFVRD